MAPYNNPSTSTALPLRPKDNHNQNDYKQDDIPATPPLQPRDTHHANDYKSHTFNEIRTFCKDRRLPCPKPDSLRPGWQDARIRNAAIASLIRHDERLPPLPIPMSRLAHYEPLSHRLQRLATLSPKQLAARHVVLKSISNWWKYNGGGKKEDTPSKPVYSARATRRMHMRKMSADKARLSRDAFASSTPSQPAENEPKMSDTMLPNPILFSPSKHTHLLPSIIAIHRACVHHDGLLATIIDVDHPTKLSTYWSSLFTEVSAGTRDILLQFADESEEVLAGVVSLSMPESETGPFRCFVEKLMVHPEQRRKGFARGLMEGLEGLAGSRGRGLIVLSTNIGYPAEKMYPKLGYISFGVLPKNGICPKTGEMKDERFFYKDLRDLDG